MAGAVPLPSSDGGDPLGVGCYDGFAPRATPRIDVMRLSLSCGPVNGLTSFARANGTVDEAEGPFVYQWAVHRHDCYRLFAVAAAPVDDLEVEIVQLRGPRVSLTNQNRRWLVVDEGGPFCALRDGEFEAHFSTHSGHGEVSVAIWRGEHMLKSRP